MSECVTALGLENEPAFAWWVSYNLKKRDRIIAVINTCVRKHSHKLGITIPTNTVAALPLDKENVNDLWQKSYEK